ncbi:MAG: ATP-binding protein [Candidatus Aenigmatarchaeota archaeon]
MLSQKEFVNRKDELEFLEEKFTSDSFESILIYGRRRVGKTELIKKFLKDKKHIYHLASREEGEVQLRKLVKSAHNFFGGIKPEINEWDDFFSYFNKRVEEETVFVIDEFPYLLEENRSITSLFQNFIDEYLKGKNIMLILSGSSIGMMEDLMSYKNPLYGRRSGQIDLQPFKFYEAREMMGERSFEDQIKFFAVFGGVPFYLEKVNVEENLMENIREKIFRETEVLYEEPNILLREEFRKPNRYSSILESIASGRTTPKAISDDTDIPPQSVPKYLNELERIRLVKHEKPVTERNKKSRGGIYQISDNLFDFWFTFVFPNLSDVKESPEEFLEGHVSPQMSEYVGKKFEEICREVVHLSPDLDYSQIGRWWYKEDEIDLVGLNGSDDGIIFSECKWKAEKIGRGVLSALEEKVDRVKWRNNQREEKYALFSKSGFTEDLIKLEREREDLKLFTLEDMKDVLNAQISKG